MASNILLLDDHSILTDGIVKIFKDEAKYAIVGTFQSGHYALSYLKSGKPVDLVVVDYSMPDMSGIEFIKAAKTLVADVKIIMLTMHDEVALIREAIASGADGYVLKKSDYQELSTAMDTVLTGKTYWSAEVGHKLFQFSRQNESEEDPLTQREMEVLKLIVKELTNKQIAETLFISERTVEVHRKNLMRKLKCNSAVGLIKYAFQNNLASLPTFILISLSAV